MSLEPTPPLKTAVEWLDGKEEGVDRGDREEGMVRLGVGIALRGHLDLHRDEDAVGEDHRGEEGLEEPRRHEGASPKERKKEKLFKPRDTTSSERS